jgi:hypothetical protein
VRKDRAGLGDQHHAAMHEMARPSLQLASINPVGLCRIVGNEVP